MKIIILNILGFSLVYMWFNSVITITARFDYMITFYFKLVRLILSTRKRLCISIPEWLLLCVLHLYSNFAEIYLSTNFWHAFDIWIIFMQLFSESITRKTDVSKSFCLPLKMSHHIFLFDCNLFIIMNPLRIYMT